MAKPDTGLHVQPAGIRPAMVLRLVHAIEERTVDVHIAQVRKKVGEAVEIRTVRGIGYRLESGGSSRTS